MIILDENLHDRRILSAIASWYPGKVVSITALRPGTVIKDEAVPALLGNATRPTFVTINVADFWKKVEPHTGFCVIAIDLPKERLALVV